MILMPRRKLKINQNGAQASPLGLSTSDQGSKNHEECTDTTQSISYISQGKHSKLLRDEQRGANLAISSTCNRPSRKRGSFVLHILSEGVLS